MLQQATLHTMQAQHPRPQVTLQMCGFKVLGHVSHLLCQVCQSHGSELGSQPYIDGLCY